MPKLFVPGHRRGTELPSLREHGYIGQEERAGSWQADIWWYFCPWTVRQLREHPMSSSTIPACDRPGPAGTALVLRRANKSSLCSWNPLVLGNSLASSGRHHVVSLAPGVYRVVQAAEYEHTLISTHSDCLYLEVPAKSEHQLKFCFQTTF